MLPKCPECGGQMEKTDSEVYECKKCKSVYVTKRGRDTLKSIFGVHEQQLPQETVKLLEPSNRSPYFCFQQFQKRSICQDKTLVEDSSRSHVSRRPILTENKGYVRRVEPDTDCSNSHNDSLVHSVLLLCRTNHSSTRRTNYRFKVQLPYAHEFQQRDSTYCHSHTSC